MEMQYNRIKKTDRTLQWNSRRIIFVWEIIIFPKDILDPKLVDWIIAKVIKIRLQNSALAPVNLNELEHTPRLVHLSEADMIRDNEGADTVDKGKSWMVIYLLETQ